MRTIFHYIVHTWCAHHCWRSARTRTVRVHYWSYEDLARSEQCSTHSGAENGDCDHRPVAIGDIGTCMPS